MADIKTITEEIADMNLDVKDSVLSGEDRDVVKILEKIIEKLDEVIEKINQ